MDEEDDHRVVAGRLGLGWRWCRHTTTVETQKNSDNFSVWGSGEVGAPHETPCKQIT